MTSPQLNTTDAVVRALGGTAAVARLTGRKLSAASNWRKARAFPANTYVAMGAALHDRGMQAPAWLWGMEARPPEGELAQHDMSRPSAEVA
jgi:hypothetical protein